MQALSGMIERLPNALLKLMLKPLFARGHDDEARGGESFDLHFEKYARHGGAAALVQQVNALDVQDTLAIAPRLPALDVPARLVWGAADPFQKLEYGERFARDLKAPLRQIEQGRHFTPEDHPDIIAAELSSLLETVRDRERASRPAQNEKRAPAGASFPRTVVLFDVVGTLFDVSALDPLFKGAFGEAAVRHEWFSQILQSAFVSTITGSYTEFSELAVSALQMVAARHEMPLSRSQRDEILTGMRELPAFPDVRGGLQRLRDAGARLAALTNSETRAAEELLSGAGLSGFFEVVLSTDAVRRFKPARETYAMAATKLGVDPAEVTLVTTHSCDLVGAVRAGCRSGFLQRPGMVLDPSAPPPQNEAKDLAVLADQMLGVGAK